MELINPLNCPYYLISRASLAITSALKKSLSQACGGQVKPSYLGVLMVLWRDDGLKVVELGKRAGLEPSTMTGLLDRMERDSLVLRKNVPSDRRAHMIYLTPNAHDIREPVLEAVNRVIGSIFANIPDEKLEDAKEVLRCVLSNSDKEISP